MVDGTAASRTMPAYLTRQTVVAGLMYLLMAPIAAYANNGMVVLLALCIFAIPSLGRTGKQLRGLALSPFGIMTALIALWCLVSLWWSPEPALGRWSKLVILTFVGFIAVSTIPHFKTPDHLRVQSLAAMGGMVALALLTIGLLTGGAPVRFFAEWESKMRGLIHVSRGTAVLVPLAWPLALIMARHMGSSIYGIAFVLLLGLVTAMLPMTSTLLAWIAGGIAFGLVWWRPRFGVTLIMSLLLVYIFFAPAFHGTPTLEAAGIDRLALPASWDHRLAIWDHVIGLIANNPLLGYGFDASRAMGNERIILANQDVSLLPLHPHNGPLQIRLELGITGVILIGGFLFSIAGVLWREATRVDENANVAMGTAALVSYMTIGALSFGVWQTWWVATGWFLAATVLLAIRRTTGTYTTT